MATDARDWITVTEHIDAGRLEDARIIMERMLTEHPELDLPHCAGGLYNVAIGRLDVAETFFKKALEINPDNLDAHLYLALTARKSGTPQAYSACRDQLLALIKSQGSALLANTRATFIITAAAECCDKVGPPEEAARLRQLLSTRPD